MKNDKDFIKYLKSIYEGVSVNEISKFAGWVAIDHKGKRLEIKKSEAKDLYNAKLLAIKKLKVPKMISKNYLKNLKNWNLWQ